MRKKVHVVARIYIVSLFSLLLSLFWNLDVGDIVSFGDGLTGKVIRLGWLETLIRGSDNIVTRVPNTALSSQKVSNLSRIRQSQVKQILRFHYEDAEKIPQIIEDIAAEIRASCPRLITDNSRPFRVFWIDFSEDELQVMVDTHHNIAPIGDAYWKNRQAVLLAITRAVKKNNVELVHGKRAVLMYPAHTDDTRPAESIQQLFLEEDD